MCVDDLTMVPVSSPVVGTYRVELTDRQTAKPLDPIEVVAEHPEQAKALAGLTGAMVGRCVIVRIDYREQPEYSKTANSNSNFSFAQEPTNFNRPKIRHSKAFCTGLALSFMSFAVGGLAAAMDDNFIVGWWSLAMLVAGVTTGLAGVLINSGVGR